MRASPRDATTGANSGERGFYSRGNSGAARTLVLRESRGGGFRAPCGVPYLLPEQKAAGGGRDRPEAAWQLGQGPWMSAKAIRLKVPAESFH